ncbi:MAG: hypothetical protein KC646_07210 [Candidatus Cloacimonetes bacterium]|nr:hypothetical protein [Candidatus Cloacimonadota bacterium]
MNRFIIILLNLVILSSCTYANDVLNDLLHQHRPHLFATKNEFSPPIAVEDMMRFSYLVNLDTNEVIRDENGEPEIVTMELLAKHNESYFAIKLKKDYTELFGRTNKQNYKNSKPVVYARIKHVPEEKVLALQYFFFYAGSYLAKALIPVQLKWHEGDTEYAQILIHQNSLKVIGGSSSIHYYGQSLPSDQLLRGEDGRVKMYIAQHSHATYFMPSTGKGHQSMMGNLGFGGDNIFSLKTVYDVTKEDQAIDYDLRILSDEDLVFTWKGRWGAKKRLLKEDKSAKAFELGPNSFGLRNAMSESLSMFKDPVRFFYFYYYPSKMYQKLMLSLKKIKDEELLNEMIELVAAIGKSRASIDAYLRDNQDDLSADQKMILSEVTPLVTLAYSQDRLDKIRAMGHKNLGVKAYNQLIKHLRSNQVKIIMKAMQSKNIKFNQKWGAAKDIYRLKKSDLMKFIVKLTGLDAKTVYHIYLDAHSTQIGDTLYKTFQK